MRQAEIDAAVRRPTEHPARLDRFLGGALSAATYVQPSALVAGRPAAQLIADGSALAVAGNALAMTGCELWLRRPNGVDHIHVPAAELADWCSRSGGSAVALRVADLLGRIGAPRLGIDGSPLVEPQLMGIVNVTPDSFSEKGAHADAAAAIAHGIALAAVGAGILDVGGESTRPGAMPVAPSDELARVRPVLQGLAQWRAGNSPAVAVSIDTRHAAVMRAALETGADIVNDVTALAGNPDSMAVAAASDAHIVLMHMQGEPSSMNVAPAYDDVALDVYDYLEARIDACGAAGIDRSRLIVDPGLGFGKRHAENIAILRGLGLFHGLGCPILLGASRKGFAPGHRAMAPRQRLPASLAAAMHALSAGVQYLRVHDVAETQQVVALWQRLVADR